MKRQIHGSRQAGRKFAIAATVASLTFSQVTPVLAFSGLTTSQRQELAAVQSSAQTIWYSTSPWSERQADLRVALANGQSVTPGVWTKGLMGRALRSSDNGAGGYNQKVYGAVAGIDFGKEGMFTANDAAIFGLSIGAIKSDVDFDSSPDNAKYKGWVGGLYATYIRGDFFIDTSLKYNKLSMEYSGSTPLAFKIKPDVTTIGGQIDMGEHYNLANNYFAESLATIAYARTSTDSATIFGTTVNFEDAKSLKASVGGKIGRVLNKSKDAIVTAALTGRVWNEFKGDNKTNFNFGLAQTTNDFGGAYGDVGASFEVTGTNGLSGFASTSFKFKSDYKDASIRVGLRLNF